MSDRSSFTPDPAPAATACASAPPSVPHPAADWSAGLREWIVRAHDARGLLFETATLGHAAWILQLPRCAGRVVLDLSGDLGNTACVLARVAERVVYLCGSDAEAAFVNARAAAEPHAARVTAVVAPRDGALAFPPGAFHCVIAAPVHATAGARAMPRAGAIATAVARPLEECVRVLGPDGTLVLRADNVLVPGRSRGGERLTGWSETLNRFRQLHSLSGYRKQLRRIGLGHVRALGLAHNDTFVAACVPLDGSMRPTAADAARFAPARRTARWLYPSYVLLASAAPQPQSLGEHLLGDLAARLQGAGAPAPIVVRRLSLSRKDKIIIDAEIGAQPLIVRVVLSEAARAGEERNRDALLRLRERADTAALVPAPLCSGEAHGLEYFAQQKMPGIPVSRLLREDGLHTWSRRAFELLGTLHAGAPLHSLAGTRYETLIERRIDSMTGQLGLQQHRPRLRQFFADNIRGAALPIGLTHGDFGVSNLLADSDGLRSLIDWEYAAFEDVCATDAVNYFDSLLRRADNSARPDVTIPQLAAWRVPEGFEVSLLRDYYARHGIDPRWHRGLVYLKWLRHVTHLSQFWLRFDSNAIERYVTRVIDTLP